MVIVSHNDKTLREYCDRVVWIDQGRVRELGDPDTVIDAYLQATGKLAGPAARSAGK